MGMGQDKMKSLKGLLAMTFIFMLYIAVSSATITTPQGAQTDSNCGFAAVFCNLGIDDITDIFLRNYEDDATNSSLNVSVNLRVGENVSVGNVSNAVSCRQGSDGTNYNFECSENVTFNVTVAFLLADIDDVSEVEGSIAYNYTSHKATVYNGTDWIELW